MGEGKRRVRSPRPSTGALRLSAKPKAGKTPGESKSILERAKFFFDSVRSISLSIFILFAGAAVAFSVARELFSNDVLIDVTEVSKSLSEAGVAPPTLAAELAARVRSIQIEAGKKTVVPTIELAYLLQSENHAVALPTLPLSTQKLLIDNVEPLPEIVTSGADSTIKSGIYYIKRVFGRDENRLSLSVTSIEKDKMEARLRFHRHGNEYFQTIRAESIASLLEVASKWIAKQLFPELSIIMQFDLDQREKDKTFNETKTMLDELGNRRGLLDDIFSTTIRGDIAFYRESYSEAAAIYRTVLAKNPRTKDLILYRVSQTLVKDSKPREALILLTSALNSDPGNQHLIEYLGMVYSQKEVYAPCLSSDPCVSVEKVKELLAKADSSTISSNVLGALEYNALNRSKAEELFRRAETLDSRNASAINNLGVIQLQNDNIGEALVLFNNAAALEPTSGVIQLNLGNALEAINRPSEAAQYFQKATLLARDNLVCHACLAISLINTRRFDEAQIAINDGINADPKNTTMIVVSGMLKVKLGCYQEAADFYAAALKIDDPRVNNPRVARDYGDVLIRLGQYHKARAILRNELFHDTISGRIQDRLNLIASEIYLEKMASKKWAAFKASSLLDESEIISKDDGSSRALIRLSHALLTIHENELAISAGQRAVELDPRDSEMHKGLGQVYKKLSEGALARAEFQTAFFLGGEADGELLRDWTDSLMKAGLNEAAVRTAASFRLDPKSCFKKPNEDKPARRVSSRPSLREQHTLSK